jgi:hypothetical protein
MVAVGSRIGWIRARQPAALVERTHSTSEKFIKRAPDEETRTRVEQRIEKARARTVAEHDFPKLVEQKGSTPLIKDNPPLIFHPTAKEAPGMKTQFSEQFAQYRDSIIPSVRPLFDRFHLCDLAIKVVGVGSVGTRCSIALFVAGDDDPLFLQAKEARASVLEPYAGKSVYSNHGERVGTWFRNASSRFAWLSIISFSV